VVQFEKMSREEGEGGEGKGFTFAYFVCFARHKNIS
jgi:hypothetical protein